jgi:hypothetical protein
MRSILQKFSFLMALFLSLGALQAQNYVFEENAQTKGFQIQTSNKGSIQLTHSIHNFQLTDVEIDGEMMKQLNFGISVVPAAAGSPDLRGVARYILIPNGAKAKVNILNKEEVVFENIEIAPAAPIPFDNQEDIPAVKGPAYEKNAFLPGEIAQAQTTEIRGMTLAAVNINPFQYNPVTKELVVYKNIELEIEIIGGNGSYGEDRFRNKYWDQILDDLVLNYSDIPKIDYNFKSKQTRDAEGCEYLIIVPNNEDFLPWADSIKLFRTEQGIPTEIVTMDEIGGNTLDNIKNYVDNIYETWDPVPAGILLMADYGNDANTITSKTYPHPYSGNFITDNYFADYTGNDLPDFVFARMTGRNYAEMQTMVTKFLIYERTPPTNFDFYNKPITALGWQTERWFQICSETVGGYMKNVLGKDPVRINAVYGGNPNSDPWSTATNTSQVLNYFGPSGEGYIPATPAELGNWTGGSATDVVNAINDGAFILQHRDHGMESGWGEPAFTMSYIDQLNNVDELSHIFSINCLTGRFDVSGECFAEKFHRYTNGGALSLTAASQVSYSFVNDAYVWGLYDNMWPDFMPDYGGTNIQERDFLPAFGNAAGKYFLSYSSWPYNTDNKQITYRLFHHHGDAFNTVYTEVPEEMAIDYAEVLVSGPAFIDIQAEEGALVAFSVDGILIGSAIASGNSESVTIEPQVPGTMIKVVITKQNYFRHEGFIQVIAPEGPYVVKSGFGVFDEEGNNNHMVDYGEDISLSFSVKNLGTEVAENVVVTISTEDEFVTLTDNEENFGNVGVDEEITHEDAFAFSIADSIPDNHHIAFSFSATNGTDIWESSFSIKAYAPVVEILDMDITEIDGNGNGRLDPGETAILSIEIENSGKCATPEGLASLFSDSDYLTINASEFEFETIDSAGMISAEFNITAADETPIGQVITVNTEVAAGAYAYEKTFNFSVGLIVEDWETGTMDQFAWNTSGNADWTVDDVVYYEGTNSVRSGDIGDNQASTLSLDYDVMVDDEISFFVKVSSESGYDYLKFFIDNSEMGSWAGEVAWTEVNFPVSAGQHTFKWEFSKDGSVSSGQDCGWVDFIILPPMLLPQANAGEDAELCHTSTEYQLDGSATDYNSLEWTTNGDGNFSANDIEDPVYYFGTEDYNNGMVVLTLTAYGANGNAVNTVAIDLANDPAQPMAPMGEVLVCYMAQDMEYVLAEEGDEYVFNIEPEEAGTIEVMGNIAYIDFAEDFTGTVSISAMAFNACGESPLSEALEIVVNEQAVAGFSGDTETCAGSEAILSINLQGVGPWSVEVMDEQGGELFFEAATSPYELMISPEQNMNYTLMHVSDANQCTGTAEGSAMVSVHELPTASITNNSAEVCGGDMVEVNLELTGAAPWNITLGDGADLSQSFEVMNASEMLEFISPLESINLQVTEITDANACLGTSEGMMAITVNETPEVNLGADTMVCHNIVYTIDAGNDGSTFAWSTGAESKTIEVDESMANADHQVIVSVEVTNGATGCVGTDEVIVEFKDCTGIEEINSSNIQVIPNPNNGWFKVNFNGVAASDIRIYNSIGEVVLLIEQSQITEQMEIDLSQMADGVYFLQYAEISERIVIRK